jgi:hypothetical protein
MSLEWMNREWAGKVLKMGQEIEERCEGQDWDV